MERIFEKKLHELRKKRNFDTENYINEKIDELEDFFVNNNLDSVVIGISGGVDSAVTCALMNECKNLGILKQVIPIFIPIHIGTTGQYEARSRAKELFEDLEYDFYEIDLSSETQSIVYKVANKLNIIKKGEKKWEDGQLASIMRTPVLYYHAAILQTQGYKSIVVGTTNRDEGSYIGFFGKASDAAVDLQPIADIHKSEVYKLANFFDIPVSIINEKPKGDVWDGRNDEEMIGCPYWFLELYILCIDYNESIWIDIKEITVEEEFKINEWINNIEKLHEINHHKYDIRVNQYNEDELHQKGFSQYVDVYKRTINFKK